MKLALINGEKAEATKGSKGICESCGSQLIARCGELNIDHWAHKGNRNCDPWWENETPWHRSWKNKFPKEWQEVVQFDETGEKHIADVKTKSGWVLEFQHSYLKPEERRARSSFYSKLCWLVDGVRRKTDIKQFNEKLQEESRTVKKEPLIIQISFPEECRLLNEWKDSNGLVFFDFQEYQEGRKSQLWFLFPVFTSGNVYLSPFLRQNFIELHNENRFDEFVNNIILPLHKVLASSEKIENSYNINQFARSLGFGRKVAMRRRRRL